MRMFLMRVQSLSQGSIRKCLKCSVWKLIVEQGKLTFNFFCINLENLTFEQLVCQIVDSKSKSGILWVDRFKEQCQGSMQITSPRSSFWLMIIHYNRSKVLDINPPPPNQSVSLSEIVKNCQIVVRMKSECRQTVGRV